MKLIAVKYNGEASTAVDRSDHPSPQRLLEMFLAVARAEGYSDDELAAAAERVFFIEDEDGGHHRVDFHPGWIED